MIVFHAADLLWASKIKGTAEALGLPARPVRTLEMLEARLGDSPVTALIVDLDAPEVALALIARVRRAGAPNSPTPNQRNELRANDHSVFGNRVGGADVPVASAARIRVVAFGPHVAVEQLQAAKRAGADAVLTRGAFHARLAETLKALSSPPESTPAGTLRDALED